MDRIEWLVKTGREWLSQPSEESVLPSSACLSWQRELLQQQLAMRRRAVGRFPDPSQWLWTQRSLAQSSDWWCARFKAAQFPDSEPVFDGCCGVGVDLVALAKRGETVGVDYDPTLVRLANANLEAHHLRPCAIAGSVPEDVPPQLSWLHLDPDRRSADGASRRLIDAEQFSPSLSQSLQLARRARGTIIKLAPGTKLDSLLSANENSRTDVRWWLGNFGECRQQLLLTGELTNNPNRVHENERRAVLCEPDATYQFCGLPHATQSGRDKPLRYVYDCHAVLHAAQLQVAWAASVNAQALGTSQGYFTSDEPIVSVWSQAFEVVDVLPWDQRRVKRWLRERRLGEIEVKKRLVQLDANEQQRILRGTGEEKLTLMITRLGDRVRAIAARRVAAERTPEN